MKALFGPMALDQLIAAGDYRLDYELRRNRRLADESFADSDARRAAVSGFLGERSELLAIEVLEQKTDIPGVICPRPPMTRRESSPFKRGFPKRPFRKG